MGRPALHNQELADRICEELMLGRSLRRICETEAWAPDMRTVLRWLVKDTGGFVAKYAHAREVQADVGADDIQDIADTPEEGVVETDKFDKDGEPITEVRRADMIEHRKFRVAVRQWNAEKLRPKKYGQKQQVELSGGLNLRVGDATDDDLIMMMLDLQATGRFKPPGGAMLEEGESDELAEDDFSDLTPEDDFSDIA